MCAADQGIGGKGNQRAKRRPLTYKDRCDIQDGLDLGRKLSVIARTLGRKQQVIIDEIKRNRTDSPSFPLAKTRRNVCYRRECCLETNVCGNDCDKGMCYKCPDFKCNANCAKFVPLHCANLDESPYCCNTCPEYIARKECGCGYLFYDAKVAEATAKTTRSERRKGVDASPEKLDAVREAAYEGIVVRKQSPEHVVAANPELGISASTLRRWIKEGLLDDVFQGDLPFAVKRRQRKAPKGKYASNAVPRAFLKGREYKDWEKLSIGERESTVEMDTVMGLKSDQCVSQALFF